MMDSLCFRFERTSVSIRYVSRKLHYFKGFKRWVEAAGDLLFPPQCYLCHADDLEKISNSVCQDCWRRLLSPQSVELPFPIEPSIQVISCGRYEGDLRNLIVRAKFRADALAVRILSELLLNVSRSTLPQLPARVAMVPGSPSRIRERGIHLPFSVARHLARKVRVPFVPSTLIRLGDAPPQTGLSREERQSNLKDRFLARKALSRQAVWLVDDVFTTGATLRESIRALGKANPGPITCLALARATVESHRTEGHS